MFTKLRENTTGIKVRVVNDFDLHNLGEKTFGESKERADLEEQSSESWKDVVEGKGWVEGD